MVPHGPCFGSCATRLQVGRSKSRASTPERVAYRMNTSWDKERHNCRGGQNRPIWIVDLKAFDLVSPPWTDSWDKDPARVGDAVYFISDRDDVANVDTGETKQVTDGLADAMYPVFDAGGKYLWFLASTDFGLRSQWLDMTSYDREETFGIYLAVLRKGEPSPVLPESDKDMGVGRGAPGGPGGGGAAADYIIEVLQRDFDGYFN